MATKTKKARDLEEKALEVLALKPDDPDSTEPLNPNAVLDVDGVEVPEDLQFSTSEKDTPERKPEDTLQFSVDGVPITAHKPSSGAWTLILSGMSSGATPANRTEAILEFIVRTVDVPSWMLLKSRMMDHEDPFDVKTWRKSSAHSSASGHREP